MPCSPCGGDQAQVKPTSRGGDCCPNLQNEAIDSFGDARQASAEQAKGKGDSSPCAGGNCKGGMPALAGAMRMMPGVGMIVGLLSMLRR